MKINVCLFMVALVVAAFPICARSAPYSGGDGSAENPYQIATAADYRQLTSTPAHWSLSFILTADINLAGVAIVPVGNSTTVFNGIFDGNGHVIRNASMNYSNNSKVYFVGLFGLFQLGQIKNLGVVNADIEGANRVGVLVGQSYQGTITACYSTGSAVATSNYVGGLVGDNMGTITSCYSTALASSYSAAGGLVGVNDGAFGKIINCYASGEANGTSDIAGLVGVNNNGSITNCYATGLISASSHAAGLVGKNSGTITSCIWDIQTTGKTVGVDFGTGTITGTAGKSTADMKTLSTFTDAEWDFTVSEGDPADWWMPANDYPRLVWQPITGDIAGLYGVNFVDFGVFAAHWGQTGCPAGCENADINNSGTVDISDLMLLADNWLKGISL